MKITTAQLANQLKQKLASIYIISGDEILLVEETNQLIKNAAKNSGFLTREVYQVDNSFNWDEFKFNVNSVSLLCDKVICELRIVNNKFSDNAKKFLQEYAQNPMADKILLIQCGKLDANQWKTKWLQALEKMAVIVQVWPINRDNLLPWIKQRSQRLGLILDQEACQLIADNCEGNLLSCAQEIEKLRLIYAAGNLTAEQISDALIDSAQFDIFLLVDSVVANETSRALHILQSLKTQGIEAILILWALTKELRLLSELAQAIEAGVVVDKVLQKMGVWQNRQNIIKQAVQRKKAMEWIKLLVQAQQIDSMIKGVNKGNVWIALSQLITAM